ncbi:MAG TPA: carboxylating nicotinate-nucleotide diphosphorylase [Burkholderiales bacterium]|nr:carboxylating nicotinate-nucleotide diphosphorylase [Burkholderiales bacterium]
MPELEFDETIRAALREDMPQGDITSESVIPAGAASEAVILAKEDGVLAGLPVARRVFELVDPRVEFRAESADGRAVQKGDVVARVEGPTVSLLKAERTALNFLQRLSGIATATRRFVDAVAGTKARILDTRKTTPGLRLLEKYAVRMGGGTNHRLGLSDMVLIKDNHLRYVGSIAEAVHRARAAVAARVKVEVEVTSLDELGQALAAGADIVMLDNMSLEETREAVAIAAGRVPLEVSGKVSLEHVREIAETGVDLISVGALTHSSPALDISLEFLD